MGERQLQFCRSEETQQQQSPQPQQQSMDIAVTIMIFLEDAFGGSSLSSKTTTTTTTSTTSITNNLLGSAINNLSLCALHSSGIQSNTSTPTTTTTTTNSNINTNNNTTTTTITTRNAINNMESLIKEDPTQFLNESFAFNICTLYELDSSSSSSISSNNNKETVKGSTSGTSGSGVEYRKQLLKNMAKRYYIHDLGPECFRL